MSRYRLLGFSGALVLAAVVGGTVISAVSAAPDSRAAAVGDPLAAATAAPASVETACATFRAALAKALGVSEDALAAATQQALGATVDQAVSDGKLTAAAAARLKTRMAASPPDGCQRLAARLDKARGALGVVRDAVTAAADALGMPPADLRAKLRSGASLASIATDKGVELSAVTGAVLTAVKGDLDAAVAAGTIPQARADRIIARLTARLGAGSILEAP
jgi:ribosomal protein S20